MPDDKLNGCGTPAFVGPIDAEPSWPGADEIVDAELAEPEPDGPGHEASGVVERSSSVVRRRTYTLSDFER